MLKAMQLTLRNLDIIAPAIGWTRSKLNYRYETNTYYDRDEYVVVEYRGNDQFDFEFVEARVFMERYEFAEPLNNSHFTRVSRR